jgi:predicted AAA+ superfamily ATPase
MNQASLIQILLGEFQDKLIRLQDLVKREARFPKAPGKIKVAIGMRRAGKTYFLYQNILNLLEEGVDKRAIFYVNFEDDRLLPLDEKKLAELVDAFYTLYPENHDRKCYLFFDEIQNVENWPPVIRRLHDTKEAEIFLTGSSARLLSKEIASSLRGRSLATEIWPYSFNEFIQAKKVLINRELYDKKTQDQLTQIFRAYLLEGGFPEIIPFDRDVKQKTLQEYLDVTIYRDMIERHDIKHPALIKYMILSMIHSVGRPFAIHKFYNDVKSQGYQIGKDILYDYVKYAEDAFLTFTTGSYHKSFRKTETTPKKLYIIDPGMVRALTLDYESDLGRLFENIIYLDLKRLGCKVHFYLTADGYEVDFLAQWPRGEKKLYQVTWNVEDPATLEREERALQAAMKELKVEGEMITLNSYLHTGIR